jgi:hypothetical protein
MNLDENRLVLLEQGADEYRGAWFDGSHHAALARAAASPHRALVSIEQSKLDQIDPDIKPGYLLPDGSPDTLAWMRQPVFERLVGLAEPSGLAALSGAAHKLGRLGAPLPWSEIESGSIVLARAGRDEGWWECVVIEVDGGGAVQLQWRDYPGEPFRRSISCVGLLSPSGLG